jgi:hypothetical protein
MGGSSSQQPVTAQTQQTKDPWAPAQPYLQQAMGAAQALYNTDTGYRPWSGATQAPLNTDITSAMGYMRDTLTPDAARGGTEGVLAARTLGTDLMQNQGLSPELRSLYEQAQGDQNPYLQAMLDTSNRQISNKIGSSMSGAGRYGSGMHSDVAARAMSEAADPILAQDYARRQAQQQSILESGQQRAGQWAQLMPTLDEARLAPAQGLMALGEYQQERDQSLLNDQIKFYNAQQAYPWEQLARYNAISGQAGGLGGSMTGTTTTPINSPSTLQKLLGGGLAGAGIGGSFGGPVGAGVGALGGGLLGMMG